MSKEQREAIFALAAMFFTGSEDITSAFYAISAAIEERQKAKESHEHRNSSSTPVHIEDF